jgi:hypothetical protein
MRKGALQGIHNANMGSFAILAAIASYRIRRKKPGSERYEA